MKTTQKLWEFDHVVRFTCVIWFPDIVVHLLFEVYPYYLGEQRVRFSLLGLCFLLCDYVGGLTDSTVSKSDVLEIGQVKIPDER